MGELYLLPVIFRSVFDVAGFSFGSSLSSAPAFGTATSTAAAPTFGNSCLSWLDTDVREPVILLPVVIWG